MRFLFALILTILLGSLAFPVFAVQTTVIVGTTEIITPSNEDFELMPLDQMAEWLFDRSNLLGTISRDIESLNSEDAVDLIRQVKSDRCCARGMNWCGRVIGAGIVMTGLASSIATLPPQVGYALAGGGALVVAFNEAMKYFTGRANDGVTTLLALQRELLEDYWEKQRIYERRRAEQERQQRLMQELNDWKRLAIQHLPQDTREVIFTNGNAARLRVVGAQDAGGDVDAMEEVEVARPVQGRQPTQAPNAGEGDAPKRVRVKTKVKKKIGHAAPGGDVIISMDAPPKTGASEGRPREKEDDAPPRAENFEMNE